MIALAALAPSVFAQSLKGSPESVDLMYNAAVSDSLTFFHTASEMANALAAGRLVPIQPTGTLAIAGASFAVALPGTRDFVERLSGRYADACGNAMIVTSAARPLALHLRNSVPKTVHPTGMAVDIRKPRDSRCLAWMRATLLDLEGRHAIEATEEFHPPHFHVAVLPGWEEHLPPVMQIASAGEVETPSALGRFIGWPMVTIGVGATPGTNPDALLAAAGALQPIASLAAVAGPLTLQLAAPLTFDAPGGPIVVASMPILDEVRSLQPQLTPTVATTELATVSVPASDSAATRVAATSRLESNGDVSDANDGQYRVRPGDSLWKIAHEHDVTVDRLRALNGLRSAHLRPGQLLRLPSAG